MNYDEIRNWLRKALEQGRTIQSIAKATGINYTTLWRFIHGVGDISFSKGLRLMHIVKGSQEETSEQRR